MKIDFSKHREKLFNKSFYEIRKAKTRFVVVYGSSNSGKSVSVHQSELINLCNSDYHILFLRKYGTDIYETCYSLLKAQAERFGITHLFKWLYSNEKRNIVNITTGQKIILKGVDDPERLKSIVGVKRVILEEANQFTFEDFTEINRRVRGMEGIQIILILNPISENHWIKKNFVDKDGAYHNDTTILRYLTPDNKWATAEDFRENERLKLISENQYRIYVLAEWGVEDKQKKFAWAFEHAKHVQPAIDNPELCRWSSEHITWLTFDFNISQMSCTVFQDYDDILRGIECIRLENSNTWEMCRVIKSKYPDAIFKVTGDSTGASGNTIAQDNLNNYNIIQQELNLHDHQLAVPSKNPNIEDNQIQVNGVLLNREVYFSQLCQPLIYDLMYVEIGQDKRIIKDRSSEKKMSDFLDGFRYIVNVLYENISLMRKVA